MRDGEGFAQIDDYGVIGDRRSAALVAADGSIDWLCWPDFHSPSVFGALLDPEIGGRFRVDVGAWGSMEYVGDTNMLETRFATAEGTLTLGDTMTRPGSRKRRGDDREILRRLTCEQGRVSVEVECAPRFDYGRITAVTEALHNMVVFRGDGHDEALVFKLSRADGLNASDGAATARIDLKAGETAWLSLSFLKPGETRPSPLGDEEASRLWEDAYRYWEEWASRGRFQPEHREHLVRSALITELLRHADTGAIIASPTTSLPEVMEGRRNYDYRFTWVRDSSLGLALLAIFGYLDEAEQSMTWLSERISAPESQCPLQVVYRADGGIEIDEEELEHLRGYKNAKPVRIGNRAWKQIQPDQAGIFLDCVWIYQRLGGRMRPEFWELVEKYADFVHDHWLEPNNGIWENADRKSFTSSLILCWVALDRAAHMAQTHKGWEEREAKWSSMAVRVRDYALDRGFDDEIGSFTYTIEDKRLDASALTAITFGLLNPDDLRGRSIIRRVRERLSRGDMLLRHLMAEEAEFAGPSGPAKGWQPVDRRDNPFHPCTLWLAQAYAVVDDITTAESIIQWVLRHSSSTGLLSEEYEPDTGEARGNYPLVFSHMELLRAIYFVIKAKERAYGA